MQMNHKIRASLSLALLALIASAATITGCAQEKRTRSVTIEGPGRKVEVEVETTEKHHDDD